jgi:hypothetical protein
LAAGALVGLAIDTRLLFAAVVPGLCFEALRGRAAARSPMARARSFATGLAAGLLPALAFVAIDPAAFYYDNLRFHALRSPYGPVGDLSQKAVVLEDLVGVGTAPGAAGTQFLLLVLAALTATAALWIVRRRLPLAFLVAASLGLASLVPTPTNTEYFATVVPFLVLAALELVPLVRSRAAEAGDKLLTSLRALAGVTAMFWAAFAVFDLHSSKLAAENQPAIQITTIQRVSDVIDANTVPGDRVVATWPGYLFHSHARILPGLENNWAPDAAARLSESEARRYRLASAASVDRAIRSHRAPLAVVRGWYTIWPTAELARALTANGYELTAIVGGARIYRWQRQ